MIVTNKDILEKLRGKPYFRDYLNDHNEIDLEDPIIIAKLSEIRTLSFIYESDNSSMITNDSSAYVQLCELIKKCPNLQRFLISNVQISHSYLDNLLELLIKNSNVENISIYELSYDFDSLFSLVNQNLNRNLRITVNKLPDEEKELEYIISSTNFRRNLSVLNFNNQEYSQLYSLLMSSKPLPHNIYQKYKALLDNYDSYSILIEDEAKSTMSKIEELRSDLKVKKIIINQFFNEEEEFKFAVSGKETQSMLTIKTFVNKEYEQLYNLLYNSKPIPYELYEKYKNFLENYNGYYISIQNVSELNNEQLQKLKMDSRIQGICILCGYIATKEWTESRVNSTWFNKSQNTSLQIESYTMEEYEQIRQVIDSLISKIEIPSLDNPDREKIIFSQIYRIIGEFIDYDYIAVTEEGRDDIQLQIDCRNLKNGLLGVLREGKKRNLVVCAGYANILQNICACFDIKCDFIASLSEVVSVVSNPFEIPNMIYKNGTNDPMGHAYNSVILDGQAYFCDLTWDNKAIKLGDCSLTNFLCSYNDFFSSHEDNGFKKNDICIVSQQGRISYSIEPKDFPQSLSYEKQAELFGFAVKKNIDKLSKEYYLANFVAEYLEFIKQCRGKIEIKDYFEIMNKVIEIGEFISSNEFESKIEQEDLSLSSDVIIRDNDGNIIGRKGIVFYHRDDSVETEEEMSFEEMGDGGWKKQ